jgi:hypothetical protein
MTKINRYQAIKLLAAQEIYDSMKDEDLYLGKGKYLTIYDILATVDISKEEIEYTRGLSFKDLSLLS